MSAHKTVEISREKIITILNKTLNLKIGSSIYIPCASKKEQQDLHTCVVRELKIMSEIEPEDAAGITHRTLFRDLRFWVVLTRISPVLTCVYIKDAEGRLTKESL
jgi:hypothetical protein